MPVDLTDVISRRMVRPTMPMMPAFSPPEEALDEDAELADLEAYTERISRRLVDAPPPPPPMPGIMETLRSTGKSALEMATPFIQPLFEQLGRAEITAGEQGREQAPAITGLGEAALGVATGAVGGAVGGFHFVEQAVRDIGEPSSPDYWKNLVAKSQEIGGRYTYAPRTQAGQLVNEQVLGPAMEALHAFSQKASEAPLSRMLLTPDQRHAVAYAHEQLTMIAAGYLGGAGVARMRATRAKFQSELSRAAKGEGNEVSLVESAEKVIEAVEKEPEWTARVEQVKEMRAKDVQQPEVAAGNPLEEMIIEQARIRQQPESGAPPKSFTTEKGSTYSLLDDQTTIRNKSYHPEHGPEDVGIQPRSERTYFVTPEDAQRLGEIQTRGGPKRSIKELDDGRLGVYYEDGPSAGRFELRTVITPQKEPSVGLMPVELFEGGRQVHFGNKISSVDISNQTPLVPRTPVPVAASEARLPASLAGAKPRYNIGTKSYEPQFTSDIDKALFITSQKTKSRADAQYRQFLTEQGIDDIDTRGVIIRQVIKDTVMGQEPGKVTIPRISQPQAARVLEVPTHIPALQDVLAPVEQLPSRPGRERTYRRERYSPVTPEERANYERGMASLESSTPTPRLSAAKKVAIAKEKSEVFSSRPEVMDAVHAAIEAGNRDAGAAIAAQVSGAVKSDIARMKFEEAFDLAHRGRKSSTKRGVMEIISDLADLFAFEVDPTSLGANFGGVRLSHRQKMAAQRLMADAQKKNKKLDTYLKDKGFTEPMRFLYSSYLEEAKLAAPPSQVGPKNMALDPYATTIDPVVQHSTRDNGMLGPPIFSSEARAFIDAPVRPATEPRISNWNWETSGNTARRYGQKIYDMTVVPAHSAKHSSDIEIGAMRKDLNKLFRRVGRQSKENMANYAMDLVEGGDRFLAERGRTVRPLSTKEQAILRNVEAGITNLLERVDEVRQVIGLEPLPPIDSPIAFARAMVTGAKNKDRTNLATTPSNIIWGRYDTDMFAPMGKTTTQRTLGMTGELDLAHLYDQFATSTIEHIKLAPLAAKLREFERTSIMYPDRPDLPGYRLQEANPGLHDYIRRFANSLEGVNEAPVGKHFGIDMDNTLRVLQENMAWGLLSFSLKSIIAQPTSLIWTAHGAGKINLARAFGDALASVMRRSSSWRDLVQNSQVLSSRKDLSAYGDWAEAFSRGSLKELPRAIRAGRSRDAIAGAAKTGMFLMQVADQAIATISGLAYRREGMRQGLTGTRLRDFIDDGIVKSQGSGWRADLAPIQRHTLGKAVTQFQTITLSDWNFVINDVLKLHKDVSFAERAWSVANLVGIITAYNFFSEDVLGIPSVAPKPLRDAARSAERGDDPLEVAMNFVYGAAAPLTPIFGGSKFGQGIGGPVIGKATVALPNALLGKPGAVDPLEPLSELAGAPGSGTYWRLQKDTGQSIGAKLLGEPPPPRKRGGGGLKGLRGGTGRSLKGLR